MPMSSVASMRKPRAEGTGGGMSVTEKERNRVILGEGMRGKRGRGKSVSGIEGKTEMFGERIREREGGRGM